MTEAFLLMDGRSGGAAKCSSGWRHLKANQYNICKDDNSKNSYVFSTLVVLN